MLTDRRPRRVPNSTFPRTSAKRVSSPPRPTPRPGWKCVACWRTIISPAPTAWPPKRLTPSRWALESRPFRLEDAPFLCAISALLSRAGAGLAGADAGDLHLRVLLPVAKPAPVAGLVLVVDHVDLGAAGGSHDLGGDLIATEHRRVADHVADVNHQDGGQHDAGAD